MDQSFKCDNYLMIKAHTKPNRTYFECLSSLTQESPLHLLVTERSQRVI